MAAGDRDPAGRHRRQPGHDGRPELDAAVRHGPDPSYPGAHGTISAAGAETLAAIYGNDFAFDVTSTALPGVERSFTSFSEAADEATVSRIYNGNHTRIDQVAGENLGRDVAQFVLRSALLRHGQRGR